MANGGFYSQPMGAAVYDYLPKAINYYNQGKQIYDLIKPNGDLQNGNIDKTVNTLGGIANTTGISNKLDLSKLPKDVQNALLKLVGTK
jgi:hypothetical protein